MMTKGMELKNDDLMMVCGGDNGDAANDKNENSSKYSVGQSVEVYINSSHFLTKNMRIIAANFVEGRWVYTCVSGSTQEAVTADDIEVDSTVNWIKSLNPFK